MASTVIEPIARFGLAARGLVYVVVGFLAAKAAMGRGGRTTDAEGAVREVGTFDAGGWAILALAIGLLAYAVWRFVQAARDLEGKGSDAKGLAVRAGYAISGLVYLGLALGAGGFGITQKSGSMRESVARALAEPWGAWAVGLAGVGVIGVGVWQFYKAFTAKFEDHQQVGEMSANARQWSRRIGRFGLAARGVTFLIIGWCLTQAALNMNAREVRDLGGALRALQQQPYGAWMLGIVALGLIAYGLLSFVDSRYRRIVR